MFFTIAAKVNTDKHYFFITRSYKLFNFFHDACQTTRTQRSAGKRNNTISTELIAAFLYF